MARPTVLLLHAFPLDSRMWQAQREVLEARGTRVVAPDLPGAVPEAGVEAWARRILAAVDGELVGVGCSMGGYVAFEIWRQAPERVAGLGLFDTRATPDTPEQRAARDEAIRTLGEEGFDAFWQGLAPRLFSPAAEVGVVHRARTIAAEQPRMGLVAALETLRDRPDSQSTLATIDAPVLVVVGEDDTLTPPADAEDMAARIGGAQFLTIPGAGHLTPLERPADVTEALLELV